MEDRQLLLARQSYAGTKGILRGVGILGMDEAQSIMIEAVGEPSALITSIYVHNRVTDITYKAPPYMCTPGPYLDVMVEVHNSGLVSGDIFCRIKDTTTGIVLAENIRSIRAGGTYWIFTAVDPAFPLTMPPNDYGLTVEVGH